MRLVSIHNCHAGMKLAKPIYNENGKILVGEGVLLTDRLINLLKNRHVIALYIHDKNFEDIQLPDDIPIEVRVEAIKSIENTFKDLIDERGNFNKQIKRLKIDRVVKAVDLLLKEIRETKNVMNLMSNILIHDKYTFHHSTNVTIYTLAMATKLQFNEKQIYEIGLGSMLHDIGKCMIPHEILNKKGKLTDEEFNIIKKHTEFGFEILRKEHEIPLLSAHCALQHHEKLDGSGYPRGLKGNEIHPYGKILAIADVFDALTSHRSYRKAMLPHEAMEFLYAKTHTSFEEKYIRTFQNSVATYPEGLTVKLNTGETGVVIHYHISPLRPVIRVIQDNKGRDLEKPYDIDLSKELSVMITQCDSLLTA